MQSEASTRGSSRQFSVFFTSAHHTVDLIAAQAAAGPENLRTAEDMTWYNRPLQEVDGCPGQTLPPF